MRAKRARFIAGLLLASALCPVGALAQEAPDGPITYGPTPPGLTAAGAVTALTGTANQINVSAAVGAVTASLSSTLVAPGTLQVTSTTSLLGALTLNTGGASVLTSPAVRTYQFGAADATTALGATLRAQSVVAGTTDGTGSVTTYQASRGTGTGLSGAFRWQNAPAAGSTGSAQNAYATAMTLDATGQLGIGEAPTTMLDVRKDQDATTSVTLVNASAGASARMLYLVNNGTSQASFGQNGPSFGTTGMLRADGGFFSAGGLGGASVFTTANQPVYIGVNNAQVASFSASLETLAIGVSFTGTIPTVSGTGSPTIAVGSTDTSGEVTSGAVATSVVITFASTKANAPHCTVTPQTQLATFSYTISTTAITVTQAATTGEKINYFCPQH